MKKIIITGGSKGLGLALCKKLKGEINILDIVKPQEKLPNVIFHKVDISTKKVVSVLKKIGDVDIVINNTGIMNRESLREIKIKDFNKIIDVNIKGSYLVSRCAKLKQNGILVFINSRHGLTLRDTSYSYTKNVLKLIAKSFSKKYLVKQAFLGPFDGGVSKTGYTKEEYEKRFKHGRENIAKLVVKLIDSKYKKLIFKEKKKRYEFK